jgi:poly(hydroxyalkanoate) depolymerase family esterase
MKTFHAGMPPFDGDAINETIRRALATAGLDTATGPMLDVTQTIRNALAAGRPAEIPPRVNEVREAPPHRGRFEAHVFHNHAGSRAYKVYVPPGESAEPRAMIVMLHGCTQSADDFAAGTQMNRLADEHGFLVVYPEQAAQANASKCWNWFAPQDQVRGAGEPSLIAGIAIELTRRHAIDPRRVYVAGLSAGAAMAVVLGETYPDLFAGVGAHSGLPYGSAHDIPSALAAMKGGRSGLRGLGSAPSDPPSPPRRSTQAVPVIVFHGDRDHTVQPTNGARIVQQARDAHGDRAGDDGLRASIQSGVARGGRRFSRTVHANADGLARIESWTLHGAGHAWSGGHASGSYTDGNGPDASAEMVRFFMSLPPAVGP